MDALLIGATRGGDAAEVAALARAGADVNAPCSSGSGATPLLVACQEGFADIAATLLDAGAMSDINLAHPDGRTPLMIACHYGHAEVVDTLLAAGASVGAISGSTPLHVACTPAPTSQSASSVPTRAHESVDDLKPCTQDARPSSPSAASDDRGRMEIAAKILAAGAPVDCADDDEITPMFAACQYGHLACVRLLSSYGASRSFFEDEPDEADAAEPLARRLGHTAVVSWLEASRTWTTPLHHLGDDVVGAARARALLRDGADLHAAASPADPTPLSIAKALHAQGKAPEGSAAHLVLAASRPWSCDTDELFPPAARTRAKALTRIGQQLSRQRRFSGEEGTMLDLWMGLVMPHAIKR